MKINIYPHSIRRCSVVKSSCNIRRTIPVAARYKRHRYSFNFVNFLFNCLVKQIHINVKCLISVEGKFILRILVSQLHNLLNGAASSNIFGSVSTPGSECRWNSLSWRSLQLSAELIKYSKNETRQHIVPHTDARTDI